VEVEVEVEVGLPANNSTPRKPVNSATHRILQETGN
jgi:hypothetical protein